MPWCSPCSSSPMRHCQLRFRKTFFGNDGKTRVKFTINVIKYRTQIVLEHSETMLQKKYFPLSVKKNTLEKPSGIFQMDSSLTIAMHWFSDSVRRATQTVGSTKRDNSETNNTTKKLWQSYILVCCCNRP